MDIIVGCVHLLVCLFRFHYTRSIFLSWSFTKHSYFCQVYIKLSDCIYFSYQDANYSNYLVLTRYLSEQKLPRRMLQLQNAIRADDAENSCSQHEGSLSSGENYLKDERLQGTVGSVGTSPYAFGDLQIQSLGNFI